MYNFEHFFKRNKHVGILFLRLFIGLRLIYGVVDNIVSWDKMQEFSAFLETNLFPIPLLSAIISVYTQFIGGVFILIGYKIRFASFFLINNFLVALIFFHIRIGDTIEGMTPALAMLFGCLTLIFHGAGDFAIDNKKPKTISS